MAQNLKSGLKTTEFWLVVVSNLLTIIAAMKGIIPPKTAAIVVAVLTGIHDVLRNLLKIKVDSSSSETHI